MEFEIHRLPTTESTNDDARRAAEQGAAAGTVFWALEQTSGRGRRGRAWTSPIGNLYCSTLLRPKADIQNIGWYSFIAALAIGDTVQEILPDALIELKWPNDVLVGGKKISGVLLESGQGYLVMGIGLNVRHFPDNPLYPTTSLAAEGAEPPLESVLNRLLHFVGAWNDILEKDGFAPIRTAWLSRARKGPMLARLPNEDIAGTFADLDPQGNLCLKLADGTERKINTGDVFF